MHKKLYNFKETTLKFMHVFHYSGPFLSVLLDKGAQEYMSLKKLARC